MVPWWLLILAAVLGALIGSTVMAIVAVAGRPVPTMVDELRRAGL